MASRLAGARAVLTQIATFPKRRPVVFGLVFSAVKTSFADYLVQRYVERREVIDKRRNLAFGLFGLVYLGGVQYALYVPVFQRLFPYASRFAEQPLSVKLRDVRGLKTVAKQVIVDQFVHHPLGYFPVFYATKYIVLGGTMTEAMAAYRANWKEDLFALWKIWVPATIVNFTVSPFWFRIPFVACTSLLWTCVLSAMRGAREISAADDVLGGSEYSADMLGNESRALDRELRALFTHGDAGNEMCVITTVGDYAPELVPQVLAAIAGNGGNVFDSRVVRLGPSVALLAIVSAHAEHYEAMLEAAQKAATGMHFAARPLTAHHVSPVGALVGSVSYVGKDAPGLVRTITEFLAAQGLGVDTIVTDHVVTPQYATGELHVRAKFYIDTGAVDETKIRGALAALRTAMPHGVVQLAVSRKTSAAPTAPLELVFEDNASGLPHADEAGHGRDAVALA